MAGPVCRGSEGQEYVTQFVTTTTSIDGPEPCEFLAPATNEAEAVYVVSSANGFT